MRFDVDLARQILLEMERRDSPQEPVELDIPGHAADEVAYHVKMLAQAHLVEAIDLSTLGDFDWRPTSLTWEGHQFLAAARDETLWARAKETVKKTTGGLAFELLRSWLRREVNDRLGLGA